MKFDTVSRAHQIVFDLLIQNTVMSINEIQIIMYNFECLKLKNT